MAKHVQQSRPLIKALREELQSVGTKLDALRDAVVEQNEAIKNAEKTRDEYYQKYPPVVISELKIPEAIERKRDEEQQERNRRDDRNYRVQRTLAIVTFFAFVAAAFYASIAYIQERDLADSIGISQIIARQTRIQSAASAISAQTAANALEESKRQFKDTLQQMERQTRTQESSAGVAQKQFGLSQTQVNTRLIFGNWSITRGPVGRSTNVSFDIINEGVLEATDVQWASGGIAGKADPSVDEILENMSFQVFRDDPEGAIIEKDHPQHFTLSFGDEAAWFHWEKFRYRDGMGNLAEVCRVMHPAGKKLYSFKTEECPTQHSGKQKK